MALVTLEGIVENGQIRLRDDVRLPESTRVYVVIPELEAAPPARIVNPRLAHPEHAKDFVKEVMPVTPDAGL